MVAFCFTPHASVFRAFFLHNTIDSLPHVRLYGKTFWCQVCDWRRSSRVIKWQIPWRQQSQVSKRVNVARLVSFIVNTRRQFKKTRRMAGSVCLPNRRRRCHRIYCFEQLTVVFGSSVFVLLCVLPDVFVYWCHIAAVAPATVVVVAYRRILILYFWSAAKYYFIAVSVHRSLLRKGTIRSLKFAQVCLEKEKIWDPTWYFTVRINLLFLCFLTLFLF